MASSYILCPDEANGQNQNGGTGQGQWPTPVRGGGKGSDVCFKCNLTGRGQHLGCINTSPWQWVLMRPHIVGGHRPTYALIHHDTQTAQKCMCVYHVVYIIPLSILWLSLSLSLSPYLHLYIYMCIYTCVCITCVYIRRERERERERARESEREREKDTYTHI